MSARVEPIRDADLQAVGEFLNAHVNRGIPVASWVQCARGPWDGDEPNHGFLLRDGERLVGVFTALYSEREIDGKTERFCNLATWCVPPPAWRGCAASEQENQPAGTFCSPDQSCDDMTVRSFRGRRLAAIGIMAVLSSVLFLPSAHAANATISSTVPLRGA